MNHMRLPRQQQPLFYFDDVLTGVFTMGPSDESCETNSSATTILTLQWCTHWCFDDGPLG